MSDMSEPPTPVEPPKRNKGGRPKGARNKRDRAAYDAIDKVRALILRDHNIPKWIAVMTPRDIMMHAMARAAAHGMWPLAADIAAKVAPYVHPRLSQVEMNVRDGVKDLTDEEIAAQVKDLEERSKIPDVAEDGTVGEATVVSVSSTDRTNPDGPIIDSEGRTLN